MKFVGVILKKIQMIYESQILVARKFSYGT